MNTDKGNIILYSADDGEAKIEVRLESENVWLTQQQMAELFQSSRTNMVEHIKHIYEENELDEVSTCRKFRQVQIEGSRQVSRELPFYNLDMIISLGYRIKSSIAKHIFEEGKLSEISVVRNFRTTTQHGTIADKSQIKPAHCRSKRHCA